MNYFFIYKNNFYILKSFNNGKLFRFSNMLQVQCKFKLVVFLFRRNYTDLVKLIKDLNHLSDNLLDVCSYYCGTQARSTTTSMDKICRELVRLTTHK